MTVKNLGLLGVVLARIEGAEEGCAEVVFTANDGRKWLMNHGQDCCESVSIEDVCGDIADLIGSQLTMAEEAADDGLGRMPDYPDSSHTWTFYKFATVKGYVTIRWYGESNGYYSEEVTFCELKGD